MHDPHCVYENNMNIYRNNKMCMILYKTFISIISTLFDIQINRSILDN